MLFVGNSYTFGNDLPGRVKTVAQTAANPGTFDTDSVTTGGATLKMHYENPAVLAKIAAGGWTHVVLQGASLEPLQTPSSFSSYAALLAGKVKAASAAVVFFETWARQAGNAVYAESWSGGNPTAMQAGLRAAYAAAAQAAGGSVAPVGDAWESTLKDHPAMPLFEADGSHPSVHGTYLAACVFYAHLARCSPVGLKGIPAGVGVTEAATLQQVAAKIVLGK